MKAQEVFDIVEKATTKEFKVIINGKVEKKRLFISINNDVCEYKKGSRRYGYRLYDYDVMNWESVTPYQTKITDVVKVRNYMNKVVKYLTASGLWANIREDYEIILSLTDDVLDDIIHSSWTDQRDKLQKIATEMGKDKLSFHCDGIIYTAKKGIKSVNYDTHSKMTDISMVESGIKQGKLYNHKWHKGYDNSVEVKTNGDIICGWYSEEYKGCGNGHYYLLLDARHAHFYEDD
jgi:hypothetical protein